MRHPLSEELQFQLEMYCQGSIYMTVKWLLSNAKARDFTPILGKKITEEIYSSVSSFSSAPGKMNTCSPFWVTW